jgi:hypothetical protein
MRRRIFCSCCNQPTKLIPVALTVLLALLVSSPSLTFGQDQSRPTCALDYLSPSRMGHDSNDSLQPGGSTRHQLPVWLAYIHSFSLLE